MIDIGADLQRAFDEGYEKGKADRPQGEWIDKGRNLWECSNCKMEIYSESEQDRSEFHKWCSRCGARMKGADGKERVDEKKNTIRNKSIWRWIR